MTVTVPVDIGSYYWGFFVVDIVGTAVTDARCFGGLARGLLVLISTRTTHVLCTAHPLLMNTMTAATGSSDSDAKALHLLVHVSGAIVTGDPFCTPGCRDLP